MNKPDFLKGVDGQWYWRLINEENGKIVASGGEGFTEKNDASEALVDAVTNADLDALEDEDFGEDVSLTDTTDTIEPEPGDSGSVGSEVPPLDA